MTLLGDVLAVLISIHEYLDERVDINDGEDGLPIPNEAMRLVQMLEGNDYEKGLLARVEEAMRREG